MRDLLFEPIRINRMEVKNRIYMPAMHLNMAKAFEVTDPLVDFYAERARGGAGMIAVGYATVDEFSGSAANIGAHRTRSFRAWPASPPPSAPTARGPCCRSTMPAATISRSLLTASSPLRPRPSPRA
jgi:hypothetical protein